MRENLANPEGGEDEERQRLLIEVCIEFFGPEVESDFEEMDFEEALGYSFTLLTEAGIEDPEEFLIEKDILQYPED